MEINVLEFGALITTLAFFGVLYFLKRKHVNFGIRHSLRLPLVLSSDSYSKRITSM